MPLQSISNLRNQFNPELQKADDSSFTKYELFLENKIIELQKREFKRFMFLQEEEIQKYIKNNCDTFNNPNECCQEWITKCAKKFRKHYWRFDEKGN